MSKSEILTWVNLQFRDEEVLTESDIPDEIIEEANAKTVTELLRLSIAPGDIPEESDDFMMLKYATQAFSLSLLCKARVITQTSGEILSEAFGEVSYQYQRLNPLFFFATGTSKPFQELLPQETFRMLFYSFLRGYERYYFYQQYGKTQPGPKLAYDKTSRGFGWNRPIDDIISTDKVYGEYREEDEERYHD